MQLPSDKEKQGRTSEGGQAAVLRDQRKILQIEAKHNLKNPEIAFEVYEQLIKDPYYFETDHGRQFLRGLLRTAIHSERYLMDEALIYERKRTDQPLRRRSEKSLRKKIIKIFLVLSLIVCLVVFLKSIYEIVEYEVLSHQSAKKIDQLISCILEPIDPYVSEENRLDDMIASGLVTGLEETGNDSNHFKENTPEVLHQYSMLYERNTDMAGWIQIPDTIIHYPVMLTKEDEEYYLRRDFDRNEDLCGLPFMDARCEIESPVSNYIIYGHNMKNGSMFSKLLKYESYEFYTQHKEILFDTIYETGVYEIMAVFQTRVAYQDEDIFRYYGMVQAENEAEFMNFVNNVREMSIYDTGVDAVYGDQLLTLSTCDRRIENGRFVVVARKQN